MKYLGLLLLLAAGGALGWLGLRADAPDYVAPRPAESVPVALTGEVPAGFAVRTFDVSGMCCTGCSAKLYAAVTRVEGVRAAAVDPAVGTAQVMVPANAPLAPLAAALTFDVYTAEVRP
jgi:copper chaperone CopZ